MSRSRGKDGPPRLLCVDKAAGRTSFDVVREVRRRTDSRRVGHAGTLDPFATGVLVLGLGAGTRLLPHLGEDSKRYRARVRFGESRVGHDPTGEVTASGPVRFGEADLREALRGFEGEVEQVPPRLSAVKVEGRRSYARFRAGDTEVAPAPRRVTFHHLSILECELPEVELDVRCSGGTYVRALARDLGRALGTPAHLSALRRTEVGPFHLEHTVDLGAADDEALRAALRPPRELVAGWPALTLDEERCARVRQGTQPEAEWLAEAGLAEARGRLALLDATGQLVAVARVEDSVPRLLTVLTGEAPA